MRATKQPFVLSFSKLCIPLVRNFVKLPRLKLHYVLPLYWRGELALCQMDNGDYPEALCGLN